MSAIPILKQRESQIWQKGAAPYAMDCGKHSLAGSVSQRACVFCGSRVVLYPIADALHIVHGPIGCASYTWDIRGALSSGPELHRMSFSTDLQERDVIFGGEKKLAAVLDQLIDRYRPKAAFVYATCIVGIIGDDVDAVCRKMEKEKKIPVRSVHSEGFKGTKKDGYKAACDALFSLVGTAPVADDAGPFRINILGEFNIGGEAWIIREYYRKMGVDVVSVMTGDSRVADIEKAHGAALNVVQCSGSMMHLAGQMEAVYGIPHIRVSYFGIEDTAKALYDVARHFNDSQIMENTRHLVLTEIAAITAELDEAKKVLAGRKAAIYVGGAFKAFSLIKALKTIGMQVVVVGSQTGTEEDYEVLREMCDEGTVILDDANPLELSRYVLEQGADLIIGGVKERPIAYKLGIGFCDHNHERKIPLAGFEGMRHFAAEVKHTVTSPVWRFAPRFKNNRRPI